MPSTGEAQTATATIVVLRTSLAGILSLRFEIKTELKGSNHLKITKNSVILKPFFLFLSGRLTMGTVLLVDDEWIFSRYPKYLIAGWLSGFSGSRWRGGIRSF